MKTTKNNIKKAKELAMIGVAAVVLIAIVSFTTQINYINKAEQQAIKIRIDNLKQDMKKIEFDQTMITNRLNEIDTVAASSISKEPNESIDVTDLKDNEFEALVRATWRLETANGTSSLWLNNHNAGGIKNTHNSNYKSYSSKEEGMYDLRVLLVDYVNKYGYNFEAIRKRYCHQCGALDLQEFMQIYKEEISDKQN